MNASDIAFGIEFETTLPGSDSTPIGPYHGGYQVLGCRSDGAPNATEVSDLKTRRAKVVSL